MKNKEDVIRRLKQIHDRIDTLTIELENIRDLMRPIIKTLEK